MIKFKIRKLESEVTEKRSSFHAKKTQYDTIRNGFTDRNNETMNQQRLFKSLSSKIDRMKKEIDMLTRNIEERSGNFAQRIRVMKEENEKKMQDLLKHREDKKMIMDNLKRDADMMKSNLERVQNDIDTLRDEKRNIVERESEFFLHVFKFHVYFSLKSLYFRQNKWATSTD